MSQQYKQIPSTLSNDFHYQHLTTQIELLENRLSLSETEHNSKLTSLNNQISLLTSNELQLKTQLTSQTAAITELNNIINSYQTEIISLKTKLSLSESQLSSLSNEYNTMKANYSNITNVLNTREDSYNQIQNNYRTALTAQNISETKINELLQIINKYSTELKSSQSKYKVIEKDNFNMKIENMNLVNELKKQIYENNNFNLKIQSISSNIDNTNKSNESLTQRNKQLINDINSLQNELISLNNKYNAVVNENEELKHKLSLINIENTKLQSDLDRNINTTQQTINKYSHNENTVANIVNEVNDNIKIIVTWINEYLCYCYSDSITIPEIQIRCDKTKGIIFEQLKLTLHNARDNINKQLLHMKDLDVKHNVNLVYKEHYDKVVNDYKLLEKKCNYLVNDIELKEFQIKSLEEVNNKIHNTKDNIHKHNNSNIDDLIQRVKQLENEKENIIKDNLTLMKEIHTLRQQTLT